MTPRPWHTGELQVLRSFASLGAQAVAILLERSVSSVEGKAKELRISLVVTGDDIDISTAPARIIAHLRDVPGLNICPLCGKRLATMRQSGMCRPCHLDQLIELREAQLAEQIRLRKLTKLRQDKRRMRICSRCGDAFFPRPTSNATRCFDCGGGE